MIVDGGGVGGEDGHCNDGSGGDSSNDDGDGSLKLEVIMVI